MVAYRPAGGFQGHVDRVLVPELAPGDIVIMDNLSSHKNANVRKAIEDGWRDAALPPTLQLRLCTNRIRLLETQGATAKGRQANARRPAGQDPRFAPGVPPKPMRKLLRRCRA